MKGAMESRMPPDKIVEAVLATKEAQSTKDMLWQLGDVMVPLTETGTAGDHRALPTARGESKKLSLPIPIIFNNRSRSAKLKPKRCRRP